MIRNPLRRLVLGSALLLLSETPGFGQSSSISGLGLTVTPSDVRLRSRTPALQSITLTNLRDSALVLHFPTTCQVLLYVEDLKRTVRVPSAGIYACGHTTTDLAIGAGKSITITYQWLGAEQWEPSHDAMRLRPGDYYAWAEVRAAEGHLFSHKVRVRVSQN